MNQTKSGFTLIEVVIAVTILAFISLFTGNMISQGVKAKKKIQTEIERTSSVKAALQLISRDISLAFNYRDLNVELYNLAQEERKKKASTPSPGPAGQPPQPPPPPDPKLDDKYKLKEVKMYSRFIGEPEKINFTARANFRSSINLQQSDQSEVGYYLENCASRLKRDQTSQCLWRRLSPIIDDEITEGGKSSVLIENVKSLKFRYLGPGHEEEWVDNWRSINGEEVMKNKFPFAVEISLVVLDKKFNPAKEVAMTIVAPIRFTNNKVDEKSTVVN